MFRSSRFALAALLLGSVLSVGCWQSSTTNSTEPIPDVPPTSRAEQVGTQSGGGQGGVPAIPK